MAVGLSLYTNVPFAVIRKKHKEHGTEQIIEGYKKVGRVLLLDVRTTGGSINDAKQYLKILGYEITSTDVVFDRNK